MELEDSKDDLNFKHWGLRKGILLSGNEVKAILKNYRAHAEAN